MIALVYGLLLSFAHYASESFSLKKVSWLPSFAAGVSITYIFIDLFPTFSVEAATISKFMFLLVLLGFAMLHLVEKFLYQHATRSRLRNDLRIEHSLVSFMYHAIVGIVIAYIQNVYGWVAAILFFIPSVLYTIVRNVLVSVPRHRFYSILVASASFIGTLLGVFAPITFPTYVGLIGILIGVVSYSVLRHSIPYGRKGSPLFFLLGLATYSAVIIWSWLL